jgi:hypothetical protein
MVNFGVTYITTAQLVKNRLELIGTTYGKQEAHTCVIDRFRQMGVA